MDRANQEFQFDLPAELIAQEPPAARGDSRLLLVEAGRGVRSERPFREITDVLRAGDLLVLNQSEVLPARLLCERQDTGGAVEVLLIRPMGEGQWLAMAKPGRRLRRGISLVVKPGPGGQSGLKEAPVLNVEQKRDDGSLIVSGTTDPGSVARSHGYMPLPPYIAQQKDGQEARQQDLRDRERYQTVFARTDPEGAASVAAPTAGLHFSQATLDRLVSQGVRLARVTLHVGPGTFQPPTEDQIEARRLHREFFHLDAETACLIRETRAEGGRVFAVGTTSLRVLETVFRLPLPEGSSEGDVWCSDEDLDPVFEGSARFDGADWEVQGSTRLFIRPPDGVTSADGLLTNFHLPGSSLLMLVACLMGQEVWPGVYELAVERKMRFYSYGDCMLILPPDGDDDG